MRVIKLSVSNLLKLKCVELTPAKHIVTLAGPNMAGKSSVLNAIWYALAGASSFPTSPVRQGEEEARIRLDLGEIIVTRKIKANGATSLVVEAQNGARFPSPQSMLSSLMSGLTFDPLAFCRMDAKKQLETLKKLVKLDVDVDALDGANAKDYETRTELNREIKRLEGQIAGVVLPDDVTNLQPQDETALFADYNRGMEQNSQLALEQSRRASYTRAHHEKAERLAQLEAQVAALRSEVGEAGKVIAGWSTIGPTIDTNGLLAKVTSARQTNEIIKRRNDKADLMTRHAQWTKQVEEITLRMSNRIAEKERAIGSAEMPIKGLTFGDGEVIYNGVPFSQASQAEALVVSTVIGMALNPRLRVLQLQDASLLDDKSLELITKLAEKGDFQLWLERIESDDPAAIHMEDGEATGGQALGMPPQEVKA